MTHPYRYRTGFYLAAAAVGAIVPWLALTVFLRQALLISALVFLSWVSVEGRRLGMARLWLYVPATFLIGLSFGLPPFLYFRSRHMHKTQQEV